MRVTRVSSSLASSTRCLRTSSQFASLDTRKAVPTHTPTAPRHNAAARPRPSPMPPAARTGAGAELLCERRRVAQPGGEHRHLLLQDRVDLRAREPRAEDRALAAAAAGG